jgi:hypothetical protein
MIKLSFQPKQVVSKLLQSLNERGKDVLTRRYGLGKSSEKMTLEGIGGIYGITRERVRQIEDNSLENIRKSKNYKDLAENFNELTEFIHDMGSIVSESELLNQISKNESQKNYVHFMLVVGNPFYKNKEDKNFNHRWYVDSELSKKVELSIKKLYESLNDDEIISEAEMISRFLINLQDISEKYKNDEILKRWLQLSKKITQNPLGDWGKAESTNINVKGIRDYAYLVIRKHGSPIHFREVAEAITKTFNKKAHVATTHNELIKDKRFVLVGRGLYALTEWGYSNGVVRDVIKDVIVKNGPLTKEEIIDKVLKERYVKENTILVNLQNSRVFKKDNKGKYNIVA